MSHELNLEKEALRELVESVMDHTATQAFGVYVWTSSHPGAELGRHLERKVFEEVFGNSPELLADEYDAYDDASIFFVVIDHERRLPAGAIRVITSSDAGFKSLDDLERVWGTQFEEVLARIGLDYDPADWWDVATLAVDAEYRGAATKGLVATALYQALIATTRRVDVKLWTTVLDVVVLDVVQKQLGRPFDYFPGVAPKRYLDSPSSVPVWADIRAWGERVQMTDPEIHELFHVGTGLEAAVSTPDWELTAAYLAPAAVREAV